MAGNREGYSKGRERSFHFGSKEHHICGMISHLGPQLAIADGVALAYKLSKENKVSLAFTGDGGTSEGDFHEALNVAAVWDLPVIFIIENNGYGLSTPTNEQYRCENLVDKAKGYGMGGVQIDGNNVLTVYDTIKGVREFCIANQKPYLIECMTFRMRGHEEASGIKYVPRELFEEWGKKDPVSNYEIFLEQEKVLNADLVNQLREQIRGEIESSLKSGLETEHLIPDTALELRDVYAAGPVTGHLPLEALPAHTVSEKRMIDAIKEGLLQSMERHPNLVLMGQDIAEYGGAFKITEGLLKNSGRSG